MARGRDCNITENEILRNKIEDLEKELKFLRKENFILEKLVELQEMALNPVKVGTVDIDNKIRYPRKNTEVPQGVNKERGKGK